MKKRHLLLGLLLVSGIVSLTSCNFFGDDTPEEVSYTVTFETNGGSAVEAITVKNGETFTAPSNPTKAGYIFDGWYAEAAFATKVDLATLTVTSDITLYAKWVAEEIPSNEYIVTFETNGGSAIAPQYVTEDEFGFFTVQKPADPTYNYKTFVNWYADPELTTLFDFGTPISSNVTIYAKWDADYEWVSTDAGFDAGAAAYPGKAKPTENVTFGRFTYGAGVYFEAATSSKTACVNNQQKDITFELNGRNNKIEFNIKYGSSGSNGTVTLYKLVDGAKVEVESWNETGQNDYAVNDLEAGTYVFGSVGSYRFYSLVISEELQKSAPNGIEIATLPQTKFLEGREFNSQNLAVYLTYENGRKDLVEGFDVDSSAYSTAPGNYTISVSYGFTDEFATYNFDDSYEVNVYEAKEIVIADHIVNSSRVTLPLEQVFLTGSNFTTANLAVRAKALKVGTENEYVEFVLSADEYSLSEVSTATAGSITVTATAFESLTDSYVINVVDDVIADDATSVVINVNAAGTVSVSNEGINFTSVNDALRYLSIAGAADSAVKTINVAAGSYKEKVEVNLPNVRLIGANDGTNESVIWYDAMNGLTDPSGSTSYSTDGSASVSIRKEAVGFYAQDITFKNYYNTHELYLEALKITSDSQAVACLVQADQSYFKNVKFTSYHDTLYAQVGRQYYEGCYIEGRTDYIFGYNATAFFEDCDIMSIGAGVTEKNGGYVVATKGYSSGKGTDDIVYGYVFNNCNFYGDENVQDGSVSIARGWAESMAIMVMNSTISKAFSKEVYGNNESPLNDRYGKMNAGPTPALLLEYNNTGDGALVVPTDDAETTEVDEAAQFIASYAEATCTIVTDSAVAAKYENLLTVFAASNGNVNWTEAWGGNLVKDATVTFKDVDGNVITTIASYAGAHLTDKQIDAALAETIPAAYKADGCYTDAAFTTVYNTSTAVEAETVIYVKYKSAAVLAYTTVNFDDMATGDVTSEVVVNEVVTIVGSSSKKFSIDANSKQITGAWGDEYKTVNRLKTGGASNADGRYVIFDLSKYSGKATIQIWAISGSSSSDRTGQLRIDAVDGTSVLEVKAPGADAELNSIVVDCGHKYYLTADASINYYGFNIIPDNTFTKSATFMFDGSDWTETYNGVNTVVNGLIIKAVNDRITYAAATVTVGEAVAADTYYEANEGVYTLTADTTFAEGKTYYTKKVIDSELAPNNDWYRLKGDATVSLQVTTGTTITFATYQKDEILINGELPTYGSNNVVTYTATNDGVVTLSTNTSIQQGYFKYIKVNVPLGDDVVIPHHVSKTTYSFVTSATDGNYLAPAENVFVMNSSCEIDYLTITGTTSNNNNSIQLKGASIKFTVKAGTLVTINGYPGYTNYTIGGRIVEVTQYSVYYAEDAEVVIQDNANKYIISIVIDPTAEAVAAATPTSIELKGVPADALKVGADLDLSKLAVKLVYSDGSYVNVTEGFTVDTANVNKEAAGTYAVTVSYGEFDATFDVVYVADVETAIIETTSFTFKGGSYSGTNLVNVNNDNSYKVSSTAEATLAKLTFTGAQSNGNDNWLKINAGATIKFTHKELATLNMCFYNGGANVTVTLNGEVVEMTNDGSEAGDKTVYTCQLNQPGEVVITSTADNTYIGFLQVVVKPLITETTSFTFKGGSYSGTNLVNVNNDNSYKVSSTAEATLAKLTFTGAQSNGNDNWLKINNGATIKFNVSGEATLNMCFYKGQNNVTVTLNGTPLTLTSDGSEAGDQTVYSCELTAGEVVITSTADNTYIGWLQVDVVKTLAAATYLPLAAEEGEYTSTIVWNEIFELDATASGKSWKISSNNKNVYNVAGEKIESTYRLQSNGSNTMNLLLADYSGTYTFEFYVRSASGDDTTRTMTVSDGTNTIQTFTADETNDGTINCTKWSITLEAGKNYVLTTSNGINFHGINVIPYVAAE